MSRQLDIPGTHSNVYTLPRNIPGRLTALSFVHFRWPKTIDPSHYVVVVQSNDAAGPKFRSISPLMSTVELPDVQYPWDCAIGVIPDSPDLPAYSGKMFRGNTYVLRAVSADSVRRTPDGHVPLVQYGMNRPNGM